MKPDDAIRDCLNENLSGLYVPGQRHLELRNEIMGGRTVKKRIATGFVFAAVLLAVAVTALAIGLSLSPHYTAVQAARKAVMEKYNLTEAMLRLFQEEITEGKNGTMVVFRTSDSEFMNADAAGEYRAEADVKSDVTVAWSHDDTDPAAWKNGDLTSSVWGAPQLQQALDRYEYYRRWQAENANLSTLPIAEQAERVDALQAAVAPLTIRTERILVPDKTDLPEDEALALAKQAARDKAGISADETWSVSRAFRIFSSDSGEDRRYDFTFQKSEESCQIWVFSPSGEIAIGRATMWDGGDMSSEVGQLTMPAGNLTAEEALAAAVQAFKTRYGLTDEMLALFTEDAAAETSDGKNLWLVSLRPVSLNTSLADVPDWRWVDTLNARLGEYRAQLDAQSGEVLAISWSLEGTEETERYTQSDWAQAKAYDSRILPWVLKLLSQNQGIITRYPDEQTDRFSVEDAAAYDQAFRDAGFDASGYNHGLPKKGDLTAEAGLALAKQALQAAYRLTEAQLGAYELTTEYLLNNGGEWRVGFAGYDSFGFVTLEAATGEIQMVALDSDVGGVG
jgi:hypothetical protein